MKVLDMFSLSEMKLPLRNERAIAQDARLPSHLPDMLPELAPSAGAVVVEVSQGRSLHLSG
jgi:hypothetical protein